MARNAQKVKPIAGANAIMAMIKVSEGEDPTYFQMENETVTDLMTRMVSLGLDRFDGHELIDEYSAKFEDHWPRKDDDTYPVKLVVDNVEKVKSDLPYITAEAAESAFVDMLARDGLDASICKETWMTLLIKG